MFMGRLVSSSFNAEMALQLSGKKDAAQLLRALLFQMTVEPGAGEGPGRPKG
jgi:hypothetical protein